MWFRPRFLHKLSSGLVHEDAKQQIQGGLPGEHYHLSAALYQHLINLAGNPVYSETILSDSGEGILTNSNDVIIVLVNSTGQEIGSDYTPPPINPTTPIGDVVTPPVVVPPPPLGNYDPYYNNVLCLMPLDEAVGVTVHEDWSQHNYRAGFAGANSAATAAKPLFGKNTVEAWGTGSFLYLGSRSTQPSSEIRGNFTVEIHTLFDANHFEGTSIPWMFAVGNSLLKVHLNIDAGVATFAVARYSYDSTHPNEIDTFAFVPSDSHYYHLCIERKDSLVQLKIDGVIKAEITFSGILNGMFCYADYYANLRVTTGICRYDLLAITPPTAPYPVH